MMIAVCYCGYKPSDSQDLKNHIDKVHNVRGKIDDLIQYRKESDVQSKDCG
jgi:hypothetical protein